MVGTQEMAAKTSWVWLNLVPSLTPRQHHRLIKALGTIDRVLGARPQEIMQAAGFDPQQAEAVVRQRDKVQSLVEREVEQAGTLGISILTMEDPAYPNLLKEIFDPPIVLYVKGPLQRWSIDGTAGGDTPLSARTWHGVAVVGSRKPTVYGKTVADRLADELARKGVVVVSGMARGIDTIAHRAALAASGSTLAVLGSGMKVCYPPENASLFKALSEGSSSAVMSEFPLDTPPNAYNFPRRNRIISGLSWATVVVEATSESGALITADFAAEQGREVLAVPGPVTSPNSQGTNRLIKEGAKLVETADDILEEVPALAALARSAQRQRTGPSEDVVETLSGAARQALSTLSDEPLHIDLLARRSGLSVGEFSAALCELELEGFAKQLSGKLFVRAAR